MKKLYDDGANAQAKALLALVENFEIEESWCTETKRYSAVMSVDRWHNCREQGYAVGLHTGFFSRNYYIIFAENRNSDHIRIHEKTGLFVNPLTPHDFDENDWSNYKLFPCGDFKNAVKYIEESLTKAWQASKIEGAEKSAKFHAKKRGKDVK